MTALMNGFRARRQEFQEVTLRFRDCHYGLSAKPIEGGVVRRTEWVASYCHIGKWSPDGGLQKADVWINHIEELEGGKRLETVLKVTEPCFW